MIGVPDYDNYVEHMRMTHPDQTPMTYEEFFRERGMHAMAEKAGRAAVEYEKVRAGYKCVIRHNQAISPSVLLKTDDWQTAPEDH